MFKTTPLIRQHQLAGAKLVDFSGWQMPLHYGSQLQEHHAVRQDAGVFDVSHMAIVEVSGNEVINYLRYLIANDIGKLKMPGKALYTCMLNPKGGIIDDLIVYKLSTDQYRLVLNAGRREKDWDWLVEQSKAFNVALTQHNDLAMLAVQGPHAIDKMLPLFDLPTQSRLKELKPFEGVMVDEIFYSRTGYTGEDGFEIQIPSCMIDVYWQKLLSMGIKPCGLGARDTLRLEAGLNLYGNDMDESTTPLESNLAWTVAFDPKDRNFIGRKALEEQKAQGHRKLVGLILKSAGVLRSHQRIIIPDNGEGEVTSGTFSPTLGHAIALGRVPSGFSLENCQVEIRQKRIPVQVVQPPFVRKGKKVFNLDISSNRDKIHS
jgi:aminomethyltransferase